MIKVKFRDGTTELRFETSPCRHSEEYAEFFRFGLPHWVTAPAYAGVHNLARCARGNSVELWRLNPSEEGAPLTGRWEPAYVETVAEQIARIEGERDAAIARVKALSSVMHGISKRSECKWTRLLAGDTVTADQRGSEMPDPLKRRLT